MLPIYEAIDVKNVISENVGHTKPWVILANTPQGLTPFVVKLFSTHQVDHCHSVSKEIFCNLLAREFDLRTPQCALIDIPVELSYKLSQDAQFQYENADNRLKFATQMLANVNNAMPTLGKNYFKNRISIDTLYAFDNFIRNSDRGIRKPNLLLSKNDAFLIDHELALGETDITVINFNTLQLEDKFTKYHLFFSFLKNTKAKTRSNFFDEFSLYLYDLSINKLTSYFDQLVNEGFNDYRQPICNWIAQIKLNCSIFVDKLKGSLQ